MHDNPLAITLGYHHAWTSGDFEAAADLLSESLTVEVPLNSYDTKHDFVSALISFGSAVRRVDLLASLQGTDDDACLIYDLDVENLGTLRVAEHFQIEDGHVRQLRQIHDTATLRNAGLGPALEADAR